MSLSTTMKDYYARQGINYDKATKRFLDSQDDRPTLKVIPVVLSAIVESSVKIESGAPSLRSK